MKDITKLSRPAQWAGGAVLLSAALAAGGVSLWMNVSSGLAIAAEVGLIFAISDIGKIGLQIVCAATGWNFHLRATWAIATLISALCALNVLATFLGDELTKAEQSRTVYAEDGRQIARLEADITKAEAVADGERKNGGCGPNCRALLARVDTLRGELVEARKRLEAKAPPASGGLPGLLAGIADADKGKAAAGFAVLMLLLALGVTELFSQAAHAGASMIMAARTPRGTAEPAQPVIAKAEAETPAPAPASRPKSGTRDYYLDRLRRNHPALAAKVHRGELSVNAASIAAGLRQPKKGKRPEVVTAEDVADRLAAIARKAKKKELAV